MDSVQFTEIAARLTPESEQLFNRMVETHLAAEPAHKFFMVHENNLGRRMQFAGRSQQPFADESIDYSAFKDLTGLNLVRLQERRRSNDNYDISSDAVRFYRWLKNLRGQPIESVETAVMQLVQGDEYARRHRGSAHHLAQALELVWSESATTDPIASEIGGHLRSALIEVVVDITGTETNPENVASNIKAWLRSRRADRETQALTSLVKLAIDAQYLNQRVTHIRDEKSVGEPPLTWDEVRRSAFLTAVCCYELDRA